MQGVRVLHSAKVGAMMLTLRFVRSATITVVSPFAMAVPVQSQAPPVSLEGGQSVEQM
jgi:hypothetical protein